MKTSELKKEIEKVIKGKSELNYFSINLTGKGQTRQHDDGDVDYFVSINSLKNLKINRKGISNSNRFPIFEGVVSSADEAMSIITEKCKIEEPKKTTLRVIDTKSMTDYYVKADFIFDCEATPASESVAWNGTAGIYKDGKGNYYLNFHDGNSAHYESATKINKAIADGIIDGSIDFREWIL